MAIPVIDVQVDALIPAARNSRTHSPDQIAQIAGSIREFGFTNPVLIDGVRGIIAGHGRVLAARKLGLATVPCIELGHLSEMQKRAYIIADNKLALNAGWDLEMLRIEIEGLLSDDFDVSLAGFDASDLTSILLDRETGENDAAAEWQGMPEFNQEDQSAYKRLVVNFATQADVNRFAELIEQAVSEKTRSIWFPAAEIGHYADKSYDPE